MISPPADNDVLEGWAELPDLGVAHNDDDYQRVISVLERAYPNVHFSNVEVGDGVAIVTDQIDYHAAVAWVEHVNTQRAEREADKLILGPIIPATRVQYETQFMFSDTSGFMVETKLIVGHREVGAKWPFIRTVTSGHWSNNRCVRWDPETTDELSAIKQLLHDWLRHEAEDFPNVAEAVAGFLDVLMLTGANRA